MMCQGAQEEPEGRQDDQETLKQLMGAPLVFLPWALPFFLRPIGSIGIWLFLGSLAIYQAILILKPA